MNDDSVRVLPALRPERKTFFEIYKNRIYVRAENDTVHMNSWVVLMSGGFDPDSPYAVHFSPNWPTGAPGSDSRPDTTRIAPGTAYVLHPGPANGSPIGFKGAISNYLTADRPRDHPFAFAGLSEFRSDFGAERADHQRLLHGVGRRQGLRAGQVRRCVREYAAGRAGRRHSERGQRPTARQIADRVDGGGGTAQEIELRKRMHDVLCRQGAVPGSLGSQLQAALADGQHGLRHAHDRPLPGRQRRRSLRHAISAPSRTGSVGPPRTWCCAGR